jgi:hypothetical protein
MGRTVTRTWPSLGVGWRRASRGAIALLIAAVMAAACGSRIPVPPTGPHPANTTNYIEVPYPPPPARVEVLPPMPLEPGAVWVDGEWAWQGKRWTWLPGGWVVPPRGAYFAPWLVYRLDNGRLLFAPGTWHAANGERLPNPVVLDAARNGLQEEATPMAGAPASSAKRP